MLDTLVQSAARLCEADIAVILRQKGSVYQHEASHGYAPELDAYMSKIRFEPGRGTIAGRTALEGKVVQVTDILDDPEYILGDAIRKAGVRTMLGVPLLRERIPIGIIVLIRRTVQRFSDRQIELATTFADQAVIAIENVRLFEDVQERIARAARISAAADRDRRCVEDYQPLGIRSEVGARKRCVESAARLCEADKGTITRRQDGDVLPRRAPTVSRRSSRSYVRTRPGPAGTRIGQRTGVAWKVASFTFLTFGQTLNTVLQRRRNGATFAPCSASR